MLKINNTIANNLRILAKTYYPKEICGVFTGRIKDDISIVNNFHWIPNVSEEENQWDYVMDPQAYMDIWMMTEAAKFVDMVGFFHTHPNGAAIPSHIDIRESSSRLPYVIYSYRDDIFAGWELEKDKRPIEVGIQLYEKENCHRRLRRNRDVAIVHSG